MDPGYQVLPGLCDGEVHLPLTAWHDAGSAGLVGSGWAVHMLNSVKFRVLNIGMHQVVLVLLSVSLPINWTFFLFNLHLFVQSDDLPGWTFFNYRAI